MDASLRRDPKSRKSSTFNLYLYDARLATAFQTDCEVFLHKFQQCHNYNFTTFAKLWKETCFIAIFKGLENILSIQAFVENCFFIIKKFLFSPDLHLQTGALYMLYGLYYKQPIIEWVKIRLTQTETKKLDEIVNIHKGLNSLEPVFVYSKMRLDGAFQYCALPQVLGLEPRFQRRYDLSTEEVNMKQPEESVLVKFKKLMEEDPELVQFEETDDEYQKLSQKYKEKLFIFPSNLGDDLKKAYSDIFCVDLSDKQLDETEQEKLTFTKKKAMTNANATYRGERKVLTAFDLDTPSTSSK